MKKKQEASPVPKLPQGFKVKPSSSNESTIENPSKTYDAEVDKYDDVGLFPKSVERAKQIIVRVGLPKVRNSGSESTAEKIEEE